MSTVLIPAHNHQIGMIPTQGQIQSWPCKLLCQGPVDLLRQSVNSYFPPSPQVSTRHKQANKQAQKQNNIHHPFRHPLQSDRITAMRVAVTVTYHEKDDERGATIHSTASDEYQTLFVWLCKGMVLLIDLQLWLCCSRCCLEVVAFTSMDQL